MIEFADAELNDLVERSDESAVQRLDVEPEGAVAQREPALAVVIRVDGSVRVDADRLTEVSDRSGQDD